MQTPRRSFFRRIATLAGAAAAPAAAAPGSTPQPVVNLPAYTRPLAGQTRKQSTFDRTGGNRDMRPIAAGQTLEVFNATGPGVISHIWFTIASNSVYHLKELVLRIYWDGGANPSVECPVGDFFGLNLGQYQIYESAYLACSPGKSLNCYFAMPFRRSARATVTNEGSVETRAFYSNIDYRLLPAWPGDALYFHTQYRQSTPCIANTGSKENLSGKDNYVFCEARGRGHLMGVTLGVLLNADGWMGEGDDMTFIDNESEPAITGTGTEDYFLGSWNFGGRDGAQAFGHHYYGAPLIVSPERTGGRYCCYRWHGDNPISFERYLKHTIEHGHANDRGDNFYSAAYWYQAEPNTALVAMPAVGDRIPRVHPVFQERT